MAEEKLVDALRNQIKLEEQMVNSMGSLASKMKNAVVRELLNGIALDSRKHVDILTSIIELLSAPTALTEHDRDLLREELDRHIELEMKMLSRIEELSRGTGNTKVRFLLDYIASDELRHHRTLKEIQDNVVAKETVTEEEWFDFLYSEAISHGAPGG